MNAVDEFFTLLKKHRSQPALVWQDRVWDFDNILQRAELLHSTLIQAAVGPGAVIAIEADFSPVGVAALLAAMRLGAIVAPLTRTIAHKQSEYFETAQIEWALRIDPNETWSLIRTQHLCTHPLIAGLRQIEHAGLILFTSGSTGRSKAVVHDFELLLRKYLKPRHCLRTLAFLLFDHIGGIDTLLYNLANGSALAIAPDHSPDAVCATIEKHRIEVLPVSPTFINLLLLHEAHRRYDLSSLKIITYGAEVMPESTLARVRAAFPQSKLLQKFGATEVGTLRSQSRADGSVWVKLGGEGFETRIVDGLLEIKAESAMLGYLNAPSPFTDDGWFKTGDEVEEDGEWLRILGRRSELINVGGEKVFPAEVESILQEMEGVEEACVVAEANPITGKIVVARVKLSTDEPLAVFRKRVFDYCRGRLARHKIPQKVVLMSHSSAGDRFKKMRMVHAPQTDVRDFASGDIQSGR